MKKEFPISIASFNMLGTPFFAPVLRKRYKKIAQTFNESEIDILCMQEVTTYYQLFLLKRYLTKFPHVAYKPFYNGPKGGLVIFSKLPFEKIEYKSYSHLGNFKDITFYTQLLKNGMLICALKDIPLILINTIVVTDFEFKWSPKNRFYALVESQVNEIAKRVSKLANETNSVVITGDFNMAKNSSLYNSFLVTTKATDLFNSFSFPTYYCDRLNYRFKGKRSDRIDFIFLKNINKDVKVQAVTHMFDKKVMFGNGKEDFLSDHIGLNANLVLRTEK